VFDESGYFLLYGTMLGIKGKKKSNILHFKFVHHSILFATATFSHLIDYFLFVCLLICLFVV